MAPLHQQLIIKTGVQGTTDSSLLVSVVKGCIIVSSSIVVAIFLQHKSPFLPYSSFHPPSSPSSIVVAIFLPIAQEKSHF